MSLKKSSYKRTDVNKTFNQTFVKYIHSIDMEIDNESIWFVEVNKKKIPLTLDKWNKMKEKAKENLKAKVIFKWVNKRSDKIERFD